MRRPVCFIILMLTVLYTKAQDFAHCSNEAFRLSMNVIVSKGNRCYDIDDREGIKQMADSLKRCITQRSKTGRLTRTDSLEYTADWQKLMGSYYYEESYYDSTAYIKAHKYYSNAMTIYQNTSEFDGDLDKAPMIHRELAQLYYKQGDYQQALEQTKMAYDAFLKAVDRQEIEETDTDYWDVQTQLAICYARVGAFEGAHSLINSLIDSYNKQDIRYGEALRKKAKILMLQEEFGEKTGRTDALGCYKEYFSLKKKDALNHFMGMSSSEREQYWMHVRPFVTDCYRLEDADAGFLYDVTLFAKGLLLQLDSAGGGRQNIHATWHMIQQRLKPDACAIEFVQYEKYGRQQMGALVLKQTGRPVFVKMASPDSVMDYKVGEYSVKSRLEGTNRDYFSKIDRVYDDSTGLFKVIWNQGLLSVIGGIKKVYFAPDGYIHRMAIEYMLPDEASEWEMHRLSSTRRLLESQQPLNQGKALVVGGVNYSKTDEYTKGNNDALAYQYLRNFHFKQLDNSRKEADSILFYRHNSSDKLLSGEMANEQAFRNICGAFPIIHISSHGKYNATQIPFGTDVKPCLTDASLSEGVIAFAGVNAALSDKRFDPRNHLDGILSAKELATLDMQEVQLAILACCETGLGKISSDGVYGIQRGLKNAGTGAMVMTLWEADDDVATIFMVSFHKRISKGIPVNKAFQETRRELLASDDESINRPCYRNVFILIDALE